MHNWMISRVLNIYKYSNNLFSLRIIYNIPKFIPGQYTKIGLWVTKNKFLFNYYSFISSHDSPYIEFYILYNVNSILNFYLYNLIEQQEIYIYKHTYGNFIIKRLPNCKYLWMISGGTGISPFLSILLSQDILLRKKFIKIIFIYNMNYCSDFNHLKTLLLLQYKYTKNFLFLLTIVKKEYNIFHNTINLYGDLYVLLKNKVIQNLLQIDISSQNSHVMICGNKKIVGTISLLLNKLYNINSENGTLTIEK